MHTTRHVSNTSAAILAAAVLGGACGAHLLVQGHRGSVRGSRGAVRFRLIGKGERGSVRWCTGTGAQGHNAATATQRVAPLAEHGRHSTASPSALGSATRRQRGVGPDRELRLMILLSTKPVDTAKSHEQASRSSSGKTEGKPPQSFCDACWRLAQLVSSCPTQPAGRSSRSPLPRYLYQPNRVIRFGSSLQLPRLFVPAEI